MKGYAGAACIWMIFGKYDPLCEKPESGYGLKNGAAWLFL